MRWVAALLLVVLYSFSGLSSGRDVVMAFNQSVPPYTFPDTDSGIELDVVREALAHRGHRLIPRYFQRGKLALAFRHGRVEATMTDLGQDLSEVGGYYADPAVVYDNILITLKERDLKIEKPEDLTDLLVVGFRGAAPRYPQWQAAPQQTGLYYEQPDQELQALGLLRGHFDVVLADRYIYRYFANKVARERGVALKPIKEHYFVALQPEHYRPVFRDREIRNDFNAGLRHLKESGRFNAIYEHYLQGLSSEALPRK